MEETLFIVDRCPLIAANDIAMYDSKNGRVLARDSTVAGEP